MTTRPELTPFSTSAAATKFDKERLRRAQERGWVVDELLTGGAPTLAAMFALGGSRELKGRSWACVERREWRARREEADVHALAPTERTSRGPVGTLADDLTADLAATAPVGDRGQVARATVREIVVNALIHRSFEGPDARRPIVVAIYTDGFDVRSPGTAPSTSSPTGFSRNPTLHGLVAALGYATQRGLGMRYVARSARLVGWRVDVADEDGWHVVRFTVDPDAVDAAVAGDVRHRVPMDEVEARLLDEIGDVPRTARDLCETLAEPATTVRRLLRVLIERGAVKRTRPGVRSRLQAYVRA